VIRDDWEQITGREGRTQNIIVDIDAAREEYIGSVTTKEAYSILISHITETYVFL
jgi:hypothetical protein